MMDLTRISTPWMGAILLLTLPTVGSAQFCVDEVEGLIDPTYACVNVTYILETFNTDGNEVDFLVDSRFGLLDADFDGFDLFDPNEAPENLQSPFFSSVQVNPTEVDGQITNFDIKHRGSVAFTASMSVDQLARFDGNSRLTFIPVTVDGSFDPVELNLDLDYEFTLADPISNMTLGTTGAGGILTVAEVDATGPLFGFGGSAIVDQLQGPEPILIGDFAGNSTFQASATGVEGAFDIDVGFNTTVMVEPGQPLIVDIETFGAIFTDGFNANDVQAWEASSDDTYTFSISSGDPNVRFEFVLEFQPQAINYGVAGTWFDRDTPGQGFVIDLIPGTQFMFVPWFTFDTISPQSGGGIAGAEQRWFTAQGTYSDSRAELTLFQSRNGIFDNSAPVDTEAVGTLVIDFITCSTATVTYDIPSLELSGVISINRLLADELCKRINSGEINLQAKQSIPPVSVSGAGQDINYGLIGGWFDELTAGQGFMFDFLLDTQIMFVAWFTYDTDGPADGGNIPGGELRWFTAQGEFSGNRADLVISQSRSGILDDPQVGQTFPVGSMVIEFNSCTSAELSYELTNFGLSGATTISKLLSDETCTLINNGDIQVGR